LGKEGSHPFKCIGAERYVLRSTQGQAHFIIASSLYNRYLLSDMVILHDLHNMKDLPVCEYLMLTNGDNLYSSSLIPATLPHMRNKVDLIG
jgi:hypothetical protein